MKKLFITLIDKYLSGTASAKEKQLVDEYLNKLQKNGSPLPGEEEEQRVKEAMWNQIKRETIHSDSEVKSPRHTLRIIRTIAIAASVIILAGIGILFLNKEDSSNSSKPSVTMQNDTPTETITSKLVHEVNTSGSDKIISLPDGSLIHLANKSELNYRQPFLQDRKIWLTGKAYFKVTQEKSKPFTVITSDISITALGTAFTVTAFNNAKQIIVRLYEGKVVVRAVNSNNEKLKKAIYLLPGQAYIYNAETPPVVESFSFKNTDDPEETMEKESVKDDPFIPAAQGSWYMFNNQPLAKVFDQLQQIFDVKIVYNEKDIQGIYFTRRYNRSDSLETILREIGILHDLKATRKEDGFIISKK